MATIGDLNWNANKAISDDDKEDEDERIKTIQATMIEEI